jgi:hypothetical protein
MELVPISGYLGLGMYEMWRRETFQRGARVAGVSAVSIFFLNKNKCSFLRKFDTCSPKCDITSQTTQTQYSLAIFLTE